ncbi:MAG TPA: hypothetical protein VGS19_06960 [Streptosporangiaceae bacterium]|nr:hypothetical protein [Streptosporangiaceae bacterium]
MHNDPITAPSGNGPWRILILDRDPTDPKWAICSVVVPSDVLPASLDAAGGYEDWPDVARWVAAMVGRPVALTPVHGALAWRVDEGGS